MTLLQMPIGYIGVLEQSNLGTDEVGITSVRDNSISWLYWKTYED